MTTLHPAVKRLRWQQLAIWTTDHRLSITRLHCGACARVHHIALPLDAVLRDLLAEMTCPNCKAAGTMTVVRDEQEVS